MELRFGELSHSDLERLSWSGSKMHLDYISKAIEHAKQGEVEMVFGEIDDEIIVKGGINYIKMPGSGFIWMVNVKDSHQGRGIGTEFIAELESRIKAKGLLKATMAVEKSNPRAKALYLRNGYRFVEEIIERWNEQDSAGNTVEFISPCDLLEKDLTKI